MHIYTTNKLTHFLQIILLINFIIHVLAMNLPFYLYLKKIEVLNILLFS